MNYILRRLGFYALAAWASLTLNFFLPRFMPGDPASTLFARFQGRIQPEQLASMREAYGVSDDPLIQQYGAYLVNIAQGDFGVSLSYFPTGVLDVVQSGFVWTIILVGASLVLSVLLGNILGVIGAWKRNGFVDTVLPPLLMFIGSFPFFFLAFVALYVLSFNLGWFPLRHAYTDGLAPTWSWEFIQSVLYHLVLPASTAILVSVGGWMLGMRNTMISTLAEDYVTMAEAKGLSQRRVMFNYAARNALLPNLTSFGMALGFVLTGNLLIEIVFAYPGLGYQLLTAVNNLDYPLMQGLFLMITLAVLAANLVVYLLYVRLDPRVRAG